MKLNAQGKFIYLFFSGGGGGAARNTNPSKNYMLKFYIESIPPPRAPTLDVVGQSVSKISHVTKDVNTTQSVPILYHF